MNPVTLPKRLLCWSAPFLLVLPLLITGAASCRAAGQLPAAPAPQSQPQAVPPAATITGIVTDSDGAAIPGARIALSRSDAPAPAAPPAPVVTSSASDGTFTLASLAPGPFTVAVSAVGFASARTSGVLNAGEDRRLPTISLHAASTTSIEVLGNQEQIAQQQLNQEEKQRVLGFVPNFYVSYEPNPVALTPKQKFSLADHNQIDPINLAITGVVAGAQQATHTFNWELGASGYAKRYAAAYGTFLTGNYLTDAIFPVVFKQDPRYFYKGTGSVHSRAFYAIANSVVCKGDNHRWEPNYSGILGGLAASGISNLYYPAANRTGAAPIFEGAAIGTGFTAVANLIQEFAMRKLTPHTQRKPLPAPTSTDINSPTAVPRGQ
jgi:hypothetical protein